MWCYIIHLQVDEHGVRFSGQSIIMITDAPVSEPCPPLAMSTLNTERHKLARTSGVHVSKVSVTWFATVHADERFAS